MDSEMNAEFIIISFYVYIDFGAPQKKIICTVNDPVEGSLSTHFVGLLVFLSLLL